MSHAPDQVFELPCDGGVALKAYRWDPVQSPKAALFFAHGMGEHALRYGAFARAMNATGFAVFGYDQRGHGEAARLSGTMGHFADRNGFACIVSDMEAMRCHVEAALPGLKIAFFGHSMGSLAGQEYLIQHGAKLAAALLSGTGGGQGPVLYGARAIAYVERKRIGPRLPSPVIDALTFGGYNRAFKPARTDSDWLSRDTVEVDKYIADPLCGGTLSTQSWYDFFEGLIGVEKRARQQRVPSTLPVFIFAGEQDPVGLNGKGPRWVAKRYERCGLKRVQLKLYPSGRHEMLNEVNRDEVLQDIVGFLDAVI